MIEHMVFLPGRFVRFTREIPGISFDFDKRFVLSFEQETGRVFHGQLLAKPDIVGIILADRDTTDYSKIVILDFGYPRTNMFMVMRTGILKRLNDYELPAEDYIRMVTNQEIMARVDRVEDGVNLLRVLV